VLDPVPEAGVVAEAPLAPVGEGTVLVVEDEAAVRALAARVLAGAGYRVVTASDGVEALEVAQGLDELDLLLTDLVMPRMGGLELSRRIAELRPDLPTAFMSGYADGAPLTGELPGPLLAKPFSVPDLLAHVRMALERRTGAAS
jgi:CheY-like chemotaxis protein